LYKIKPAKILMSPISITTTARTAIEDTLTANKIPDTYGLRVGMKGSGCGGTFLLGFDTATPHDERYIIDGIQVFIDKRQLMYVIGNEVDYEETEAGAGFTISKI
jgi:iron-sulfur cluster assembly protein